MVTVFTARDKSCEIGFCTNHGTESILRFQTLFGNSCLLKDFKTYFSLFMGWEKERFHNMRKD